MATDEAIIPVHKPDVNEQLFFLLSGAILSVPLTLFVSQYASGLLVGFSEFSAFFISAAVFAPLIEEFAKVYPLFYRHGETQRSIVTLAIFVGLGFSIIEFITYITLGARPIDRIPGLLFHPASTAIAAYGIATKKPLPYYVLAVSLHAANNAFAILNPFAQVAPTSAIIVAITVYIAWKLYSKTKNKFIDPPHFKCPTTTSHAKH
ncbi:MAG: PrsW family intramembrane metalloprotease [Candidatus Bathyarchaeota archaeon]|nr:PrsW family intramembrane metalloprotease [Candidatus Bathyarchaeota archaeon]